MFEDTINALRSTQSDFNSKVKDAFGKSIDEKVFEPVNEELEKFKHEYELAELKMNEIKVLTIELRTIL